MTFHYLFADHIHLIPLSKVLPWKIIGETPLFELYLPLTLRSMTYLLYYLKTLSDITSSLCLYSFNLKPISSFVKTIYRVKNSSHYTNICMVSLWELDIGILINQSIRFLGKLIDWQCQLNLFSFILFSFQTTYHQPSINELLSCELLSMFTFARYFI
jgi:hypothetical protein